MNNEQNILLAMSTNIQIHMVQHIQMPYQLVMKKVKVKLRITVVGGLTDINTRIDNTGRNYYQPHNQYGVTHENALSTGDEKVKVKLVIVVMLVVNRYSNKN